MADAVERRLEALLEGRDYITLRQALADDATGLAPASRAYFTGVLANRQNRLTESIRLLRGILPDLEAGEENAGRLRSVLLALADDYVKTFHYALAADTFATLEGRFGRTMTAADRSDNQASLKLFGALRGVPPQRTETPAGPFRLPLLPNPLGLPTVPIEAGGTRASWVLDTGASLSTLSETAARQIRVKILSHQTVPVGAVTGKSVPGQVAVASTLRIGGATLRNVAFLVLRDQDLYVAPKRCQVHATLGFPALAALGRLTFFRNGLTLRIAPATRGAAPRPDANLFLEALQPLVAARTGSGDSADHLFTLDTGAKTSFLTLRYSQDHRNAFAGETPQPVKIGGAGGVKGLKGYVVPAVTLLFAGGRRAAALHQVPALTVPVGQPQDSFYGNLGQDALSQFAAYTLDFTTMRLTLG